MKKPLELIKNSSGGIDALVEIDSGNARRILTGKPEVSLRFWQDMRAKANLALAALKQIG